MLLRGFLWAVLFLALFPGCWLLPISDSAQIGFEVLCVVPQVADLDLTCADTIIDLDEPQLLYAFRNRMVLVSSTPVGDISATLDGVPVSIVRGDNGTNSAQLLPQLQPLRDILICDGEPPFEFMVDLIILGSDGSIMLQTSLLLFCDMEGPAAQAVPVGSPIFEPLRPRGPVGETDLGTVERGSLIRAADSSSSDGTISTLETDAVSIDGQFLTEGVRKSGHCCLQILIPYSLAAGPHVMEIWDASKTAVRARVFFEVP